MSDDIDYDDDIVTRLRYLSPLGHWSDGEEAAEVIAHERAKVVLLRAALRLACVDVFGFCDPLATSPDELAESYISEARNA